MQKSESGELVYKTVENAAQPAAAAALPDIIPDAWVGGIADAITQVLSERDKETTDLRRQVDQLTGKVDVLLALLQGKSAEVVVLPKKSHA